jgi:type VI secretion system protein ImpA
VAADDLIRALGLERQAERVTEVHEAITLGIAGLDLVRNTFIAQAGHESAPNFERLRAMLAAIAKMIESAVPDLAPASPEAAAGAAEEAGTAEAGAEGGTAAAKAAPLPPEAVPDHAAAAEALRVVESYFRAFEPSSPSLILVHQARTLIGRPLVEALALLMPERSAKAALRFQTNSRFDIALPRMTAITEHAFSVDDNLLPPAPAESPAAPTAPDGADGPADGDGAPPAAAAPARPQYSSRTRPESVELMLAVEAFFRQIEPSSPVPILLERARSYLNRDFASLVTELLPKE